LTRLYTALKDLKAKAANVDWDNPFAARFREAMNDDFNTPEAVAVLFDLANELNKSHSARDAALLKSLAGVLGLLQRDPTSYLQSGIGHVILPALQASGTGRQTYPPELIEKMIADRAAARKAKNFSEADRIRKELLDAGIVLEDASGRTTWRRS